MEDVITDANQDFFQEPLPVVRDNLLGKRKRITRLSPYEWAFAVVSFVNVATCIALSIYRLVIVVKSDEGSPDFTFTILLMINSLFSMFYVIHGLLKELRYEIYVLIPALLVVFFYCIIEYIVNGVHRTDVKLARLVVVCVTGPVNVALAVKVAYDFGWLEFRILGAAEDMLQMYRQACWFLSLIKFDLQVACSFLVLILKNGKDKINLEIILVLSIGLTVSVVWCIFGAFLVKRESKICAWIFAVTGLAAPVFVLFKVVRMYEKYDYHDFPQIHQDQLMLLYSTIIIGALLILIRSVVYVELVFVYRSFGKGLRRRAFEDTSNDRAGLLS